MAQTPLTDGHSLALAGVQPGASGVLDCAPPPGNRGVAGTPWLPFQLDPPAGNIWLLPLPAPGPVRETQPLAPPMPVPGSPGFPDPPPELHPRATATRASAYRDGRLLADVDMAWTPFFTDALNR